MTANRRNRHIQRPNHRRHSNMYPFPLTLRMGNGPNTIPINMRVGPASAVFNKAVVLTDWARPRIRDIDIFSAIEYTYTHLAQQLYNIFCPHNTIVALFKRIFTQAELDQFNFFTHGFSFSRRFDDPDAHQERHAAAVGIYPQVWESVDQIQAELRRLGAEEVGQRIGINIIALVPSMYGESDTEDIQILPQHATKNESNDGNPPPAPPYSPVLTYPPTPSIPILTDFERTSPPPIEPPIASIPPFLLSYLTTIDVNKAIKSIGENCLPLAPEREASPCYRPSSRASGYSVTSSSGSSIERPLQYATRTRPFPLHQFPYAGPSDW